jgi:hypothetical protein
MYRRVLVFALLAHAAGCTKEWKPLDATALNTSPPRSIGVVSTTTAPFFYSTVLTNGLVTGLVGVAVGALNGESIASKNHLVDPSSVMATRLADALSRKQGLLVFRTPKVVSYVRDVPQWDTDLILQATTESWGLDCFLGALFDCSVSYRASMELRDARDGRVVASGECQPPSDDSAKPTYDLLLAQKARLLKWKLGEAATYCAHEFSRELLGIQMPDDNTPPPVTDPKVVHRPCHIDGTHEWAAADPTQKQRLLHACWDRQAAEAKALASAPAPVAPAPVAPDAAPDGGAPPPSSP